VSLLIAAAPGGALCSTAEDQQQQQQQQLAAQVRDHQHSCNRCMQQLNPTASLGMAVVVQQSGIRTPTRPPPPVPQHLTPLAHPLFIPALPFPPPPLRLCAAQDLPQGVLLCERSHPQQGGACAQQEGQAQPRATKALQVGRRCTRFTTLLFVGDIVGLVTLNSSAQWRYSWVAPA